MFGALLNTVIFWAVVVFAAHWVIDKNFDGKIVKSRARYQARAAELARTAASAHAQRQMETHLTIARQQEEQDQELKRAWGTALAPILKNPSLTIAQTLQAIGLAVAPKNTRVEVTIDRFTNFDVAFELPKEMPVPEMATLSARLLEFGSPYLQHLSFFANRHLIGEMDGSAMTAATSGRSSPDQAAIAQSLVATLTDLPTLARPATTADAKSEEGVTDGAGPYNKIMTEWHANFEAHTSAVSKVIEELGRAIDLQSLKGKADVEARLKTVDATAREIAAAHDFFPRALDLLKEQFAATAYDPLVVTIALRHASEKTGPRAQHMGGLLSALDAYQAAVRRLLQTLNARAAEWKISDRGITFTNPAAMTAFNLTTGDLQASIERVNRAAKMLNSTVPNP